MANTTNPRVKVQAKWIGGKNWHVVMDLKDTPENRQTVTDYCNACRATTTQKVYRTVIEGKFN